MKNNKFSKTEKIQFNQIKSKRSVEPKITIKMITNKMKEKEKQKNYYLKVI